jgi:aspartate aminotransferase
MTNNYLADRTKLVDSSGIRKVFDLAATMKDPINFSIGLPDFDVPQVIKAAAVQAIEEGHNRYSLTAGLPELREALAKTTNAEYGWDDAQAMVASGVSGALLLCFMSLINPGDEVIIPDPYFVMYKHVVHLLGGKCVYLDTYPDFRLSAEKLEAAITDKTKLVIMNSPANPTGFVYNQQDVNEAVEVARKHDLIIMSDEIYDKFCYLPQCPSPASIYEKTILLKGFSKSYAMTGWRMAYVAVTKQLLPLLNEMIKLQQYTFVCAPTPFQKAALAAMDYDVSDYVRSYANKRDAVYNGLKDKFNIVKPEGAFYMFVETPDGDATKFVEKAIKNNVLIIPGGIFSQRDTHFRISYATTDEKIAQGVEILNSLT